MLREYDLDKVIVRDAYLENAFEKELDYLRDFDTDRLLAGFYETAGLKPKALKYPGWESSEIRGHSIGHYLMAIAQAYKKSKDKIIKTKIDSMILGLKEAQLESGYLSAFDETLFDNVEQKKPCWVPWYTMDKILNGLYGCATLADNKDAYEILDKLGDWVYSRTSKWDEDTRATVLAVEYGGMNLAMYQVYELTGKENHLAAAHAFDEETLLEPIHNGEDILNGKHANTTIPKIVGALERYIAMGQKETEKFYLETAMAFWDMVVEHHSYITGGNSEWEHFGEPFVLDRERTNCNCETCNTYNMLKLSRNLFAITLDKKYMDFYENTFINAILSSQNPETGMTMYFQPMATGYFKVYSTPFDSFWCCTGTGMENFTKLGDTFYLHDDESIYINCYFSSDLETEDGKISINSSIIEGGEARITADYPAKLRLRKPDWAFEDEIMIEDNLLDIKPQNGYYIVDLNPGEELIYRPNMRVIGHTLPDNKGAVAFKYGPVVLSAALGKEDMNPSKTGVDVTIATKNFDIDDFLIIDKCSDDTRSEEAIVAEFVSNANEYFEKKDDMMFILKGTDKPLVFSPHYRQHTERYGIYWQLCTEDSDTLKAHRERLAKRALFESLQIDSIPIGNDQYELTHNIQGKDTGAYTFNGLMFRHAWGKEGWFSYDMKVDGDGPNFLLVKYISNDHGRVFDILIDGKPFVEAKIENRIPGEFYDEYYEIPEKFTKGKDKINIKFATKGDGYAGSIYDRLYILSKKV
ncbi:MAG: glycoside hydrolase family 127 protein [Eubacterium sp.]|nr:glycoside hydrolase family 127 protein [Eubacterium sp.]